MENTIKALEDISKMQHVDAAITITGFSEDYFGFDSYTKTVDFTPKNTINLIKYLIKEESKDKNEDSVKQKEWRVIPNHICPKCNKQMLCIHTNSSNLPFICNTNDKVECKHCGLSGHWVWENEDFGYVIFNQKTK